METLQSVGGTTRRTERQASKKLWIKELLEGQLKVAEGTDPNVLATVRGDVHRVSLIGVVISRDELPVSTLMIDDGTGQIQVRSFDVKFKQSVGVVVHVVGRPRTYQGRMYVAAEAAATVDAGWAEFRKAELGSVQRPAQPKEQTHTVEPAVGENKAELLIRLIKELDDGMGAPVETVVVRSQLPDAEQILDQMLLAGDIFELRPGKVKVL